jgi:hypothetical protein
LVSVKHAVNMPQRRAMLLKLTATFIWHLKRAPAVWRSREITAYPFNQPSPPYMNAARQRNTSGWVQSIYFYYKNIKTSSKAKCSMAGGFYANLDGRWWCESNRGLLQRSATAPLTSRGLEPLRCLQTTSMLTHIKTV